MTEIPILLGEYILTCFFFRNSARAMIDDIKINSKLYSKYYCMPAKYIRMLFGLKKEKIPTYLYFRLYISIIFGFLAPTTSIICLATQFNPLATGIMLFIPPVFTLVDTPPFLIMSHIFKK